MKWTLRSPRPSTALGAILLGWVTAWPDLLWWDAYRFGDKMLPFWPPPGQHFCKCCAGISVMH